MTMLPVDPNSIKFKPETQALIRKLQDAGYVVMKEPGVSRWSVEHRRGGPRRHFTSVREMTRSFCKTCGVEMTPTLPGYGGRGPLRMSPATMDCGGDCWGCVAKAEMEA